MDQQILWIGLGLALKHFVFDGPLQTPFQYLNKGKFLHPGGLLHAGLHGFGTAAVLLLAGVPWVALALLDAAAHYTIDLVKTRATKREWAERINMGLDEDRLTGPYVRGLLIKSDWYFYALVLDQALHFATYAVILAAVA